MSRLKSTKKYPQHIAVIMDGNGRWAARNNLPRIEGHKKGADSARQIIDNLIEYDIPYVTLYVFSTENWNRPKEEIEGLFALLEANLDFGISIAVEKGARILHVGKTQNLPDHIQNKIKEAIRITENNSNINIILAFNYGGRDEIVEATKKIVASGIKPDDITEKTISSNLYSSGIPDPDLVIRTAGEMRLSNFLLWQSAYAEIYFTPVLWPDFDKKELDKAIKSFSLRKRRFGRIED